MRTVVAPDRTVGVAPRPRRRLRLDQLIVLLKRHHGAGEILLVGRVDGKAALLELGQRRGESRVVLRRTQRA